MARRVLTFGVLGVLCAAIASGSAAGDGGPVYVEQGLDGVARGNVRYVAFATGDGTVLELIQKRGGRVLNYTILPGNYGVPMVAYDGTTDGLSRDGRTLILGDIAGGPELKKRSSFAVVDVRRFRLRQTIDLRGDFAFDAMSPNGRMLYLIQHVSIPESRYRVRVYDRFAGLLLPKTVTDPKRWQSVMQGVPLARATTMNGRWAFTVYGGNKHPFVHALDTVKARAVCIDLPLRKVPSNHSLLRIRIDRGGRLVVHTTKGRNVAVIRR
jgi:hypothetical protein